jgi:hypothetical protein
MNKPLQDEMLVELAKEAGFSIYPDSKYPGLLGEIHCEEYSIGESLAKFAALLLPRTEQAKERDGWISVDVKMPEKRIRVIAAQDKFVIGDCFFGRGDITIGMVDSEGYLEAQAVECWRYTHGGDPVKEHLQPTKWMDLPDADVNSAAPAPDTSNEI